MGAVFLSLFVLALLQGANTWSYLPEIFPGVLIGKEKWGGVCDSGQKQSPIDLNTFIAERTKFTPLVFSNYQQAIENAEVVNTGHTVQVNINSGQQYNMSGGGLPDTYIMDQLHFHWLSEHTIDDIRFALELHIVSHRQSFANFSEAVKHKDGVAVLGVLFIPSFTRNSDLQNIVDSIANSEIHKPVPLKKVLKPGSMLPNNIQNYMRYEGSLTTPTCDETVIWTVMMEPVKLKLDQIVPLTRIRDDTGARLTHNYRSEQPLNYRTLYLVDNH